MGLRRWRAQRRGRLAADRFPLPDQQLDLDAIVAQAEAVTGRRTVLERVPMDPAGPSGRVDRFGSRAGDLDLVQVPDDVDPRQQGHIAWHEIAHIALGHVPIPARGVDLSAVPLLAAVVGAEVLADAYEHQGTHLRGCSACEPLKELEAESFARRLSIRVDRARKPHARPGLDRASQQFAERVDDTFGVE